jgi:pyruvate dehydrogenase E1 component alpha subunit
VATQLLHATGVALASKLKGEPHVSAVYFGEGSTAGGDFHEALNFAAIHRLPVVFVCENNGYAESTPVRYHCAASDIANRAGAYEIPGVVVDGLDVFAVYEAAGEAIARARRGEGPSLLEAKTYRFYGHFQGDQVTYRTTDELELYKQRDPIAALRNAIVDRGIASEDELNAIDSRVTQQLDDAWAAAKAAPFPEPEEALTDVYVTY